LARVLYDLTVGGFPVTGVPRASSAWSASSLFNYHEEDRCASQLERGHSEPEMPPSRLSQTC